MTGFNKEMNRLKGSAENDIEEVRALYSAKPGASADQPEVLPRSYLPRKP